MWNFIKKKYKKHLTGQMITRRLFHDISRFLFNASYFYEVCKMKSLHFRANLRNEFQ